MVEIVTRNVLIYKSLDKKYVYHLHKETYSSFIVPSYNKYSFLLFTLFIVVHIFLVYATIQKRDLCLDEPPYYSFAKRWLMGKPDRVMPTDDSKSPVVAVALLPRIIQQVVHPEYKAVDYGKADAKAGRYMMIVYSFLLSIYLYKWSWRLLGNKWWYSFIFFVFDPLLIAHAGIIGTDVAVAFFLLATIYHVDAWLRTHHTIHFYLSSILTGLGIITKVSFLYIIPLLAIVTAYSYFYKHPFSFRKMIAYCSKAMVATAIIVLVINLAYYFKGTCRYLDAYHFQSNYFTSIQHRSINLPVPFPVSFIQSLDLLKHQEEIGGALKESTYQGVYVAGRYKQKGGFWFYYLYTALYKIPLLFLLLLLSGIAIILRKKVTHSIDRSYQLILVTCIWFLLVLSLLNTFQTGIRHLLIIMPFIYLICAAALYYGVQRWRVSLLPYIVLMYALILIVRTYPYYFAYTNELITDQKTAYKKIGDTSTDYGQNDSSVDSIVQHSTFIKRASAIPDTGWLIINQRKVLNLEFYYTNPYKWLKDIKPVSVFQGVNLLYHISEEDLKRLKR